MAVHHVAFATSDTQATHEFYTDAMGFRLAKVVTGGTPEGGWAKHLFYDTGDGMIAFWELHLPGIDRIPAAISTDLGLPDWVNHIAFRAADRDELDEARRRWTNRGVDVLEVDHGFCISIYTHDPNGILVEWCMDTRPLDESDHERALHDLVAEKPAFEKPVGATLHPATSSTA